MRYKCLKNKLFCQFFYNILTVMYHTHTSYELPSLTYPWKRHYPFITKIKTEGNRNILPAPISLHNNTYTYPNIKPNWFSSHTSISPFTRCMQTLFSRASQPTANAVLSTLRFNFLASSGIDYSFHFIKNVPYITCIDTYNSFVHTSYI